jgi:hypothetical protein
MKILRFVIDDVEFFVDQQSGATGLSISGLARLCGVSQQALSRLIAKIERLVAQAVSTKNTPEGSQTQASNDKSVTTKTPKSVTTKTPPKVAETQASNDESVTTKTSNQKSKGGRPKNTEEDLPAALQILLDGDIYLGKNKSYKNTTILNERACSAILYYYAVQAEETFDAAKQAIWEFQQRGFRSWVHGVTQWEAPPLPAQPPAALTRAEQLGITPRYIETPRFDRYVIYNILIDRRITAPMYRLYLYMLDCENAEHRPAIDEIADITQISKRSIYDLVQRMRPLGLIPAWLELDPSSRSLEAQIRDRLHSELGGAIEVQTTHGPVDLLTATELIEIKRIEDWKTGFGQILAKANDYPDHRKRLHLFGNSKRNLANIKLVCAEFEITVTHEMQQCTSDTIAMLRKTATRKPPTRNRPK